MILSENRNDRKIWIFCMRGRAGKKSSVFGGYVIVVPLEICREYSRFYYEAYRHCFGCTAWTNPANKIYGSIRENAITCKKRSNLFV